MRPLFKPSISSHVSAVILSLAILGGYQANAQILTNGSFETNTAGITPGNIGAVSSATLTGWTVTGDGNWYMSTGSGFGTAENGSFYLNVSNFDVSQSFAVLGGNSYTVTFSEALRSDWNGITNSTVVSSISLSSGTASGTVTLNASNNVAIGSGVLPTNWQEFSFTFTPSENATATLNFSTGSDLGFAVIDNVSVVPEPAAWVLLIFGMGSVLILRKRRQTA